MRREKAEELKASSRINKRWRDWRENPQAKRILVKNECPHCGNIGSPVEVVFHITTGVLMANDRVAILTPSQSVLISVILERYPANSFVDEIHERLVAARAEGGPSKKAVPVMIHQMRERLAVVGLTIRSYMKRGYTLETLEERLG